MARKAIKVDANKAYVDSYTGGIKFSVNEERKCLTATYGEDSI